MKTKKLYLLRHAKSSWKDFAISDFDRPLNKRGEHDAPIMATRMSERDIALEVIISSPAKRAKSTAKYFSRALSTKVIYDKRIYEASAAQLKEIIKQAFKEYDTIMIVGHNPFLTILSNDLSGYQINNMPTTGIMGIAFDSENIDTAKSEMLFFDYPKKNLESIQE